MMYKKHIAILCISILGVLLSLYAINLTMDVRLSGLKVQSLCTINALFDCNFVAASEYALFFGIPVAWWAFAYYLWICTVVGWTIFFRINQRPILQIALLISILAAVFSIAKAWQMIFQLKVVCLVCLLMYFANVFIALLLIGLSGLKHKLKFTNYTAVHQQTEKKQSIHNLLAYSPGLFSAIVVFFMAYLVMNFSFPDVARNRIKSTHKQSISNDTIPDNMLANHFAQTKRDIKLVADVPMWGNARAGITVVEFSDFQCPFCQIAAGHLKDLLSEFKNQIKLYFIHYPLDKSVNPHITTSGHKYAGLAARAAIYAFDKGQFWQFHDDLFQRQTELNKETVFSIARNYGWNITQFETAVKSIDMINRLKKHIKCGQDTEIQGTPTLYINGRLVEQWQNVSVLRAIIQHEMQLNKGI